MRVDQGGVVVTCDGLFVMQVDNYENYLGIPVGHCHCLTCTGLFAGFTSDRNHGVYTLWIAFSF